MNAMGLVESELLTLHRTHCIHTSMNDRKLKLFISYIYSYSTACRKVLIFSCPSWMFHFFHATKPPNSHGFCEKIARWQRNFRANCRKFSRETRGWSRVMHDVCCIHLKVNLFKKILRVKLPIPLCCGKNCLDHAWILHVSRMKGSIFRTFTRVTHAKENWNLPASCTVHLTLCFYIVFVPYL